VVHLINQTSENTARVCLLHKAKADTNYAEQKVRLGDIVDSDGSNFSPDSEVSDEDLDKKPKAVKTKSPSQKQPAYDIVDGDEEEDEEEEVSIIGL